MNRLKRISPATFPNLNCSKSFSSLISVLSSFHRTLFTCFLRLCASPKCACTRDPGCVSGDDKLNFHQPIFNPFSSSSSSISLLLLRPSEQKPYYIVVGARLCPRKGQAHDVHVRGRASLSAIENSIESETSSACDSWEALLLRALSHFS